ncbi:MAG: hypothetical protein IPN76_19550 [Saprospiraceae bacterium]|nr:hypothetical protein [Saprospiraceae bacterium]
MYGKYCYPDTHIVLEAEENPAILEHIAARYDGYREVILKLGGLGGKEINIGWKSDKKGRFTENASLFVILFVAATMVQEADQHTDIDLKDNALVPFRQIIAKKLLALEESEHKGLGKALYLLAKIFASEKMGYTLFPEAFFKKVATHFGNPDLLDRIKKNYPEQVKAFVNIETKTTNRKDELSGKAKFYFVRFHHDVLPQQGIVFAPAQREALKKAFKFGDYELSKLLEAMTQADTEPDPNGLLTLWLWMHTDQGVEVDEDAMDWLKTLLRVKMGGVVSGLFKAVLLGLSRENSEEVCRVVLALPQLSSLYNINVAHAFRFAKNEDAKKAAEAILSQADFFKLPDSIVSTALNKASSEAARTASEAILSQPDFFKLPDSIVSTALNKAGSEAARTAAEAILKQADFFKNLRSQIVSTALNKASSEAARTATEAILSQADFFKNLPSQIVSTSLNKASSEAARTAAEAILEKEDFFKNLPFEIVSTAMNKATGKEAKAAAEAILEQEDFFKLPDSIVSTALKKAGGEEAKKAAEIILEKVDLFHIDNKEIVSTALKKAGGEEAKKAAEIILEKVDLFHIDNKEIVSTAMNKAGSELAKAAAEAILKQADFFKNLAPEIVSTALKVLNGEKAAINAARTILNQPIQDYKNLYFSALKTLVLSSDLMDKAMANRIVSEIHNRRNEYANLSFTLLYLPYFGVEAHRSIVSTIIKGYKPALSYLRKTNVHKVLNCYAEYPDITYFQYELKQLCRRILLNCVEDITYQYNSHSSNLTLGHIHHALRHPDLATEAAAAKAALTAYGEQHEDFKQSALYKEAAGIEVAELEEDGA